MTEVFADPRQSTQQNMPPGTISYEHVLFQMLPSGSTTPSLSSAGTGVLMGRKKGAGEEDMESITEEGRGH